MPAIGQRQTEISTIQTIYSLMASIVLKEPFECLILSCSSENPIASGSPTVVSFIKDNPSSFFHLSGV